MNADHAAQLRLLDLQAADTALSQLQHRRGALPELAALKEREANRSALALQLVELETSIADVATEQRRLENDVDTVRTRAARDEQRLQSGGVPAKELSGLQHEIATLARRQGTLEDELLEIMEKREEADTELAAVRTAHDAVAVEIADLQVSRDTAFAEIDASATQRVAERKAVAGELPADLLALYEKARVHNGGVGGAALLRQRRCEGCRIELSGTELSAVRTAADDAVLRCDNCRRILVRTDESGI